MHEKVSNEHKPADICFLGFLPLSLISTPQAARWAM
jgi:hypothetical protein